MALSRLLQPNSTLSICRSGLSAARARFCSSICSNGDIDNPTQLKDEAVAEDKKIMSLEQTVKESLEVELGLPKATSPQNVMAGYGGPHKPKILSDIFMVREDVPTETMAENEGGERDVTYLDYLNWFERSESLSQSSGFQKGLDLKCSSTKSTMDLATLETDRQRKLASVYQSSEHSNESREEDAENHPIKSLVECIETLRVSSNPTKACRSTGLIKDDSLHSNVERSNKHDELDMLTFPGGTSKIEDKETIKSGFVAVDLKEQKEGLKDSLPISNKDRKLRQRKNSARTESEGNRVLVRFLKSFVTELQIFEYFKSCGEILKIECHDSKGLHFKTSYIDFKTTKGLEEAVSRSGSNFYGPITVESATLGNRTTTTSIPSLLGDPDIPAALVKYPTRTIRIEQLTQEMNSYHIVDALAFCKSSVSGYFLGSSHSVAYVEFETEIGKEQALAKHSINVLGRDLVMLRIDCPRTTAVRISSTGQIILKDVLLLCKSLGDINSSRLRKPSNLDVHFKVAEWPNMLKILNRINGFILGGMQLQAAPAPVFPPEVLLALWRHPEERKHVKATAQALLHNLGGTLSSSELAFLENDFFSM